MLVVAVLVLGGAIGGAFAGGMVLGKSQSAEAAQVGAPPSSPSGLGQQFSGGADPQSLDQLRQRIQSGEVSQEEIAQLRQGFQGQFGRGGAGGQGFTGRANLTGTIERVEGNTVTVNTSQGPLHAAVGEDTAIRQFAQLELADLLEGMQVTVVGVRGDDGTVEAQSILLVPEGDGFFGGGDFSRGDFFSGGDRAQRD